MSDLKASPYIVTCRGISKGHCAMRKKALYGLGGGGAESSSLYLAYMDVTLKKIRKSRCFSFLSYRRIKMFEKTNRNKLG